MPSIIPRTQGRDGMKKDVIADCISLFILWLRYEIFGLIILSQNLAAAW